jgi:hypothetical protein
MTTLFGCRSLNDPVFLPADNTSWEPGPVFVGQVSQVGPTDLLPFAQKKPAGAGDRGLRSPFVVMKSKRPE